MRMICRALLIFALASLAHAAYVYGDIYSSNLEKVNRTAIRVEGRFSYALVTDKANYSIFLPEGDYEISGSTFDGAGRTALYTKESVRVGTEDQRVDLVLKPAWPVEPVIFAAVLALVAAVFLWSNLRWGRRPAQVVRGAEPEESAPPPTLVAAEPDDDAKSVLRALDAREGRATQKELREALHFSDAKLSLILTELEQTGHVKKFKRGRANVVRKISPVS